MPIEAKVGIRKEGKWFDDNEMEWRQILTNDDLLSTNGIINNHADAINKHGNRIDILEQVTKRLDDKLDEKPDCGQLDGKADLSWVKEIADQSAAHEALLTGTGSTPGIIRQIAELACVEQRLRDAIREGKWMTDFAKTVVPLITELDQRQQAAHGKLGDAEKRLSEIRAEVQTADRLHSGFVQAISGHEHRLNELLGNKLAELTRLHQEATTAHQETIALRDTLARERAAERDQLISAFQSLRW